MHNGAGGFLELRPSKSRSGLKFFLYLSAASFSAGSWNEVILLPVVIVFYPLLLCHPISTQRRRFLSLPNFAETVDSYYVLTGRVNCSVRRCTSPCLVRNRIATHLLQNTNVVQLVSFLKKDDYSSQMVYYQVISTSWICGMSGHKPLQSGVGTYLRPNLMTGWWVRVKLYKAMDAAIAWFACSSNRMPQYSLTQFSGMSMPTSVTIEGHTLQTY